MNDRRTLFAWLLFFAITGCAVSRTPLLGTDGGPLTGSDGGGSMDGGRSDDDAGPGHDGGHHDGGHDGGPLPSPTCATPTAAAELATSPAAADPRAVAVDAEGNVYAGGSFVDRMDVGSTRLEEHGLSRRDGFVLSFAPDGALRWSRSIGDAGDDDQSVMGALVVGDLVVVWGVFTGQVELHVPGPWGERPPLPAPPSTFAGATSFLAGLRRSDGATVFAQAYAGRIEQLLPASATDVLAIVSSTSHEDMGCTGTPTSGDLLIARLDTQVHVEVPSTGALAPTCRSATHLTGGSPTGATLGAGGELFVSGTTTGDTLGATPIVRPTTSTGGTLGGFIARFAPDLTVRWARGQTTHPHTTSTHPSHVWPSHLAERDGALVLAGRVIGSADLGTGTLVGAGGGTDWDLFVARIDPATGATEWSELYANAGPEGLIGIHLDADEQIHLAGTFFGPTLDLGGALLTGANDVFVATLGADGGHGCSRASTGSAGGVRGIGATAVTPSGHEWVLLGGVIGSVDLGSGPIGVAGSDLRRVFVQRLALVE